MLLGGAAGLRGGRPSGVIRLEVNVRFEAHEYRLEERFAGASGEGEGARDGLDERRRAPRRGARQAVEEGAHERRELARRGAREQQSARGVLSGERKEEGRVGLRRGDLGGLGAPLPIPTTYELHH